MKPLIGVIARKEKNEYNRDVLSINEEIYDWIKNNGGIPYLIMHDEDIDKFDGIIIPGGNDWTELDEIIYLKALEADIPILGICLGMQLMCKVDCYKNEKNDFTIKNNTSINHHQPHKKYVHKVILEKNSKLYSIIKTDNIVVNSRHNFHVPKVEKLKIVGISEDKLIEAVEYPNKKFVIGLQWHPESMSLYDENQNQIIKEFIKACKS